jgi:inner membrane protein
LLGTEQLAFSPIATESKVTLTADWPHPSFGGSFLPSRREVTDSGFTASWELSSLATSASTAFTRQQRLCSPGYWGSSETYAASAARSHDDSGPCLETMDTEFVNPVNVYSLSERATKYGILFVILTFVAVGLFEVMKKLRVHPVQYLLVGSALCSFFLLLISLSEHLGFATAYAIAASSCVALLAFYASHILGSISAACRSRCHLGPVRPAVCAAAAGADRSGCRLHRPVRRAGPGHDLHPSCGLVRLWTQRERSASKSSKQEEAA